MRRRITLILDLPEIQDGAPVAPYVIEALLTYVRGVETGAFGSNAFERIKTITRVQLSAAHENIEDKHGG